ncbi:MAG: small multi-drug export protein [Bacillota bacterium]
MIEQLMEFLKVFPPELQLVILSAIPVTELRATIPLAIGFGMEPLKALIYALIGNFLPIIPLLLGLPYMTKIMEKYTITDKFMKFVFARTRITSTKIRKYGAVGLMMFVAVPLPGTGVWVGSAAAFLFGIPFKFALLALTGGMIIAGILVTLASVGILQAAKTAGMPLVLILAAVFIILYIIYKRNKF